MDYEIIKRIGVLEGDPEEYHIEINIMTWGNGQPKLDIRRWSNKKPGRGVCISEAGLKKLREMLKDVTL